MNDYTSKGATHTNHDEITITHTYKNKQRYINTCTHAHTLINLQMCK